MRPVRAQASLTGEHLFYGREKTVKDTVHFSCNIIGSARLYLRSQHQCRSPAYIREHCLNISLAKHAHSQQITTQPYRFQLD